MNTSHRTLVDSWSQFIWQSQASSWRLPFIWITFMKPQEFAPICQTLESTTDRWCTDFYFRSNLKLAADFFFFSHRILLLTLETRSPIFTVVINHFFLLGDLYTVVRAYEVLSLVPAFNLNKQFLNTNSVSMFVIG